MGAFDTALGLDAPAYLLGFLQHGARVPLGSPATGVAVARTAFALGLLELVDEAAHRLPGVVRKMATVMERILASRIAQNKKAGDLPASRRA